MTTRDTSSKFPTHTSTSQPTGTLEQEIALEHKAECLWEELGGDLCICQRPEVAIWCEKCQQRINLIYAALRARETPAPHGNRRAEIRALLQDYAKGAPLETEAVISFVELALAALPARETPREEP